MERGISIGSKLEPPTFDVEISSGPDMNDPVMAAAYEKGRKAALEELQSKGQAAHNANPVHMYYTTGPQYGFATTEDE